MKTIQRELPFPVSASGSRSKSSEKHLQALGRPRRIKPSFEMDELRWKGVYDAMAAGATPEEACDKYAVKPAIIKASIAPTIAAQLKRVGQKIEGNATLPDVIRMAVSALIEADLDKETASSIRVKHPTERCKYIKVLFSPEILLGIGHQDQQTGLCGRYGLTRQEVIDLAIASFLEGSK